MMAVIHTNPFRQLRPWEVEDDFYRTHDGRTFRELRALIVRLLASMKVR